jgi:hypothetical protein
MVIAWLLQINILLRRDSGSIQFLVQCHKFGYIEANLIIRLPHTLWKDSSKVLIKCSYLRPPFKHPALAGSSVFFWNVKSFSIDGGGVHWVML